MKDHSQRLIPLSQAKLFTLIFFAFCALLLFFTDAYAKPVSSKQAKKAVTGWLQLNPSPLSSTLGGQVENVETFSDSTGMAVYYIVHLESTGYVIVSADDLIEPIIGFVSQGEYDPSEDNPLGALVGRDMAARVASIYAVAPAGQSQTASFLDSQSNAQDK